MIEFKDVDHARTEDGVIVLTFFRGERPVAPARGLGGRAAFYPRGPGWEPWREVATMQVAFSYRDSTDPHSAEAVTGVSLNVLEGDLTPTDLQRFAWGKWIRVADTLARNERPGVGGPGAGWVQDEFSKAALGLRGIIVRPPNKRPGRKGHGDDHYRDIARRYVELRVQDDRSPTATIARELTYSRHTVAGWVKEARRRGFLAPARKGRAG